MHGARVSRRLVAFALCVVAANACASLRRYVPARFDDRELAVYRTVTESLYLKQAAGKSLALVSEALDTACAVADCPSLERRWGLDSLWWSRDDRAMALRMRDNLLAHAGQRLTFSANGIGNVRAIPLAADRVPAPTGDATAWLEFIRQSGASATLRFSPIGFSPDGGRAIVIVRMACGPKCGHWLGTSLERHAAGWKISDVLLVQSDRLPVRLLPPP